jgi:hypothetical protein
MKKYQRAIKYMYQMTVKYSKWPKTYQHFPLQGPPKYTQNWTFDLQTIWQPWIEQDLTVPCLRHLVPPADDGVGAVQQVREHLVQLDAGQHRRRLLEPIL